MEITAKKPKKPFQRERKPEKARARAIILGTQELPHLIFGWFALVLYTSSVYLSAFSLTAFLDVTTNAILFQEPPILQPPTAAAVEMWANASVPLCVILFLGFSFVLVAGVAALERFGPAIAVLRFTLGFGIFAGLTFFVGAVPKLSVAVEGACVTISSDMGVWGGAFTVLWNIAALAAFQRYLSRDEE